MQFVRLDTVCINAINTCIHQIFHGQITVCGVGINLQTFCLQFAHIFLFRPVHMKGNSIDTILHTIRRNIIIIRVIIQIQRKNPAVKIVDLSDPFNHFLIVQLRNDAIQHFGMTNVFCDTHQITELTLYRCLIRIFCICHQIHIRIIRHQIHQIHRTQRGLFKNNGAIHKSLGVHNNIPCSRDIQSCIGTIFFKVMTQYQHPVRSICKVAFHHAETIFPCIDKGFFGIRFYFIIHFPKGMGNQRISLLPVRRPRRLYRRNAQHDGHSQCCQSFSFHFQSLLSAFNHFRHIQSLNLTSNFQ